MIGSLRYCLALILAAIGAASAAAGSLTVSENTSTSYQGDSTGQIYQTVISNGTASPVTVTSLFVGIPTTGFSLVTSTVTTAPVFANTISSTNPTYVITFSGPAYLTAGQVMTVSYNLATTCPSPLPDSTPLGDREHLLRGADGELFLHGGGRLHHLGPDQCGAGAVRRPSGAGNHGAHLAEQQRQRHGVQYPPVHVLGHGTGQPGGGGRHHGPLARRVRKPGFRDRGQSGRLRFRVFRHPIDDPGLRNTGISSTATAACNATNVAVGTASPTLVLKEPDVLIAAPAVTLPYCAAAGVTLTVTNSGQGSAYGFQLSSNLVGQGVTISNLGANWSYSAGVFTYTPLTIAAGATVPLYFAMTATNACVGASGNVILTPSYTDACGGAFAPPETLFTYATSAATLPALTINSALTTVGGDPTRAFLAEPVTVTVSPALTLPGNVSGNVTITATLPAAFNYTGHSSPVGSITVVGNLVTWVLSPAQAATDPTLALHQSDHQRVRGGQLLHRGHGRVGGDHL